MWLIRWYLYSLFVLFIVLIPDVSAVQPADALGDHMVLQRNKPVPIWGTAKADEKVTVSFSGQIKAAVSDKKGQWLIRLDPLQASTEPRELIIRSKNQQVTIKDVLVGDVWIAGGQSNMGRDVNRSWRPDNQQMNYPHIRFLKVSSRGSQYPQTKLIAPPPPKRPRETQTMSNQWHVCSDRTTPECCAVGFFFAERVYQTTGIPQGLLWNAWAGSTAKEWIPRFGWWLRPELTQTAHEVDSWYPGNEIGRKKYLHAIEEIAAWTGKAEKAVQNNYPFPYPHPMLPQPPNPGGNNRGTTYLYNGRVHPLVPYAITGILWYQGESDYANRGYVPQIEAMVEAWRKLFATPGESPTDLPFYFVQMQRCGSYMSPQIRDQQFQSYFTIPNAGMGVLLDLDMNLHPANKYDTGRRLALWALANTYGKDVIYSGPLYKHHRTEGNKIIVEFDHTHGELFIGKKNKLDPVEKLPEGKLINLEITADGHKWLPAQSRIEGENLIAWSDIIQNPKDVRYCWKSKADEPFLYNRAGLPAAQFNTTTNYAITKKISAKDNISKQSHFRPKPQSAQTLSTNSINHEVRLSTVISENCVLQRGVQVPIWGRADTRTEITVTFAGQTKKTTADRFGRWSVKLDPMVASIKAQSLIVTGPMNSIKVNTVYVGDVWLYLSMSFHLNQKSPLRIHEPKPGTLPPICFYRPTDIFEQRTHSRRPQAEYYKEGSRHRWNIYQPPGKYYARDAWYLGMGLGRETGVPVGVLGLGASSLESMTPPAGFQACEKQLGEVANRVAAWTPDTAQGKKAYLTSIRQIKDWLGETRSILQREEVTFADLSLPPLLPGPPAFERAPTTHYNNVIHRVIPAAVRGIIIQPKVHNVGDPQYAMKAKALIAGLRKVMGRQDVPVCFIQMHSPDRYEHNSTEEQKDWIQIRAAQTQLMRIPHTTVVPTYDLDPKQRDAIPIDLALRAAQWAAALVKNTPIKTGPMYNSHRIEGNKFIISFENVGEGLMVGWKEIVKSVKPATDTPLTGFQITGSDLQWHDAEAVIKNNTVIVSSDKVKFPVRIRYAWASNPFGANLYNRAGFPALPFMSP